MVTSTKGGVVGFVTVLSLCPGCRQPFIYNPSAVPSVKLDGWRKPICRGCLDRLINPDRIANGLEPIVPLPGAYDPFHDSE